MNLTPQAFAQELIAAPDPLALLAHPLPLPPLDLMIALHQEALRTLLSDLAYATHVATVARAVADSVGDEPLLHAQAHWTSGNAVFYVPDYAKALGHFDAALAYYGQACTALAPLQPVRDIRAVYNPRIICLCELGRYHEVHIAIQQAEQWLHEAQNERLRLTFLLNTCHVAGRMGDYARMAYLAEATVVLAEKTQNTARQAHGWINLGLACVHLGRFDEAEKAFERGIAAAHHAEESLTVARGQWNLARLQRFRGQLFAALGTLRSAAQGLAQAENEVATVALEEAALYEQLYQFADALAMAMRAANGFAALHMPTYSIEAALTAARIAIGRRQFRAGEAALALIARQMLPDSQPIVTAQLSLTQALLLVQSFQERGASVSSRKLRSVRQAVQRAVAVLVAHQLPQEVAQGQLLLARLDSLLGNIPDALRAYEQLVQHQSIAVQLEAHASTAALLPPAQALPHLQQAAALAVAQRRSLPMEELQARYSSEASPHHQALARCLIELGQTKQALETVWQWQAGPLLDLRAAAGQLDAIRLAELESAKSDLARLRANQHAQRHMATEAFERQHTEAARHHAAQAVLAAQAVAAAEQRLTMAMRAQGDRTGQAQVPAVGAVQARLTPSTLAIEYAQLGDVLGCFLICHNRAVQYHALCRYDLLAPLLDKWQIVVERMMLEPSTSAGERQMRAVLGPFWQLLLAPLAQQIAHAEQLVIAPYGMLHNIPWAAVFDSVPGLAQSPLLVLTPSVGLWAAPFHQGSHAAVGPPHLLGYAGAGVRHLAHVAAELQAVARHLPDAVVNHAATGSDLRSACAPRLLHIAAHGQTIPHTPLSSTIELADGPFLLIEAHRLDLRGTELVVLSACETGTRPDYGDMALALAGAFLCAGAKAVVASLWPVSDAAAAQLMEAFYAALANALPPAAALRQAQQSMRTSAPLDWATFQLWVGADDAI